MSDQNYLDESDTEGILPLAEENNYSPPNQLNFDPQALYYFRFAHDPTMFLRIINPPLANSRRFIVSNFNETQPQAFRYRIGEFGTTQSFNIFNGTFFFNDRLMTFDSPPQLATTTTPTIQNGSRFVFTEVRNGIYELNSIALPNRFIGLDNAVTSNSPEVFVRSRFTPIEREWFITTDPFAPLPPLRPIEEGIYTIHTTRLPTSAIETPQSINQESEPFIRRFDGNFHQLWQFVYDNALNAYQIINYTDQCLFAYDSGIPGTPPRQRYRLRFTSRLNQTTASYFYVNPAGDGSYTLVSVKYPDQKFDLTLGITTDFNRVQLYQQNDYEAQNWLLKRVV